MRKYYSMQYCTSNEVGQREVVLTYERGVFEWIFRLPRKTETYISCDFEYVYSWYTKSTGICTTVNKYLEIEKVVRHLEKEACEAKELSNVV